ncbi:conserved hypothetical protein [Syntrophobacter sp. SbD1]|nr:conserved hypothetical protein [Syntrophobacter sp. SbD1]
MSYAQYRLYLNDVMATADQLSSFEDITIEQEMDKACQGKFQVPICVSQTGVWDGETEAFLQGMSRIRLEIQIQSGAWVPLIDGPIINIEGDNFYQPGQSMLTLVVSDDSFYLHRDETVSSFQGSDDQIALQIYDQVPEIASTDVDAAPAPSNPAFDTTVLRGTQMECLQQLATRQHMHAFVRCGDSPGQSVGCFKLDPDPAQDFGLSPMVLVGNGANIFSFKTKTTVGQMATFQSERVDLNDRSTDARTSDLGDINLQGTNPPPGPSIQRLLKPGQTDALTLARAVQAESERAAYALSADGEVMKGGYGSVLQPYQYVQVLGANGTISGTWLIRQVTHTLTRNSYGQSFQVMRNAQSAGTNGPLPQVPSSVF